MENIFSRLQQFITNCIHLTPIHHLVHCLSARFELACLRFNKGFAATPACSYFRTSDRSKYILYYSLSSPILVLLFCFSLETICEWKLHINGECQSVSIKNPFCPPLGGWGGRGGATCDQSPPDRTSAELKGTWEGTMREEP